MHFVDENDKIVTQNLTKRFIDHRRIALAANAIAELAFHHAECGFDIRALVVMLQELFTPELKVGQ